jgi:hypothetical protein
MCRTDAWPSRLILCFFECLCLSRLLLARWFHFAFLSLHLFYFILSYSILLFIYLFCNKCELLNYPYRTVRVVGIHLCKIFKKKELCTHEHYHDTTRMTKSLNLMDDKCVQDHVLRMLNKKLLFHRNNKILIHKFQYT